MSTKQSKKFIGNNISRLMYCVYGTVNWTVYEEPAPNYLNWEKACHMPVFSPDRKKSEEWSSHMRVIALYLAHNHSASRSPVFRLCHFELEWFKSG